MADTMVSTRSGSTGRLRKADLQRTHQLVAVERHPPAVRLMTVSSRSCTRSNVVKRKLQPMPDAPAADDGQILGRPGILHLGIQTVCSSGSACAYASAFW